jgi:hypothetical protein
LTVYDILVTFAGQRGVKVVSCLPMVLTLPYDYLFSCALAFRSSSLPCFGSPQSVCEDELALFFLHLREGLLGDGPGAKTDPDKSRGLLAAYKQQARLISIPFVKHDHVAVPKSRRRSSGGRVKAAAISRPEA